MTAIYPDTKSYIQAHPTSKTPLIEGTYLERFSVWLYKNPTTFKVILSAAIVLGGVAIATLPLSLPILAGGAIAIAVVTGVTALAASVALALFLNLGPYILPVTHNMAHHAFQTGQVEAGKLYYKGDVPVLELDMKDPYKAGLAEGTLLADSLQTVFRWMDYGIYFFYFLPPKKRMLPFIETLKPAIPPSYLLEMQGLIDGYNKKKRAKIDLDDLIRFHLLADSLSTGFEDDAITAQKRPMGCTSLLTRNATGHVILGRTLDWYSFGVLAIYSLLIVRKNDDASTVNIGFPGLIGALTGINRAGLAASMNTSAGTHYAEKGQFPLLATLFNRYCLENCQTITDMETLLRTSKYTPLANYHLILANEREAATFHFYQDELIPSHEETCNFHKMRDSLSPAERLKQPSRLMAKNIHFVRKLQQEPLITTNGSYGKWGLEMDGVLYSEDREKIIGKTLTEAKGQIQGPLDQTALTAHALQKQYVNNQATIHSAVIDLHNRRFTVAFDNAYAASRPSHSINLDELFQTTEAV